MKRIYIILLSIIITLFFIIKFSISPMTGIFIFLLSLIAIEHTLKFSINKKILFISLLLSLLYVVCDSIELSYSINIINRYLVLNISGYFIIFYLILFNLFLIMDKYKKNYINDKKILIGKYEILNTSKISFLINFLLFFIIYLLFLYRFYPGNLTYDSFNQLKQATGIIEISNNHSFIHTSLLMLFVKIGMIFNNINFGVFLYMLFQIIICSLVFSFVLYFMAKEKFPLGIRIFALLFFLIHPINIVYSITLWKDILFSLLFLLFTINIYYLSTNKNFFCDKKNIIIFSLVTLLLMYMRNNGPYIVIISFIIISIILIKKSKKIVPIFLSIISLFFISKLVLFSAFNIDNVTVGESLSLPSQSLARIYKTKYDELAKKDKKEIEKFYSKDIGNVYNPIISDNVKGIFNSKYFSTHKSEYINLNLRLIKKYYKEYLESFISNSYGYYYINTDYPSLIFQMTDMDGVIHKKIISNTIVGIVLCIYFILFIYIILKNMVDKKNFLLIGLLLIPIIMSIDRKNLLLRMFLNIGIYNSIILVTLIYNIRNKKNIIYYIPSIISWLIILLSPVYSEFRYLYGLFLLIPFYIGLSIKRDS